MMSGYILAILSLAMLPAQTGRFASGYQAEDHGVSIGIIEVHSSPRCRAYNNCPWMITWDSRTKAKQVEIDLTVAGFDAPVVVVIVPGAKDAPLDLHNPVFTNTPLATVRLIEFTLRNGYKVVGQARFQ